MRVLALMTFSELPARWRRSRGEAEGGAGGGAGGGGGHVVAICSLLGRKECLAEDHCCLLLKLPWPSIPTDSMGKQGCGEGYMMWLFHERKPKDHPPL